MANEQKIAYLANQYPAVSHTFIRREIAALEQQGVRIERLSVRRSRSRVVDDADIQENQATTTLLHHPFLMLASAIGTATRHPRKITKAAFSAYRSAARTPAGLKYIAYLLEACRLNQICKARNIAHIHVHMGTNPPAVAQLCKIMGGPTYSITMHGPDEWKSPKELDLAYKTSGAEFVACISDHAASELRRVAKHDDMHKICVIRCGVDDAFLDLESPLCPDSQEFVCVGRLCAAKGQLLLLDVFKNVVARHPKARLTLCGDGEIRAKIQSRIAELGLEQSVLLTGWATQDDVVHHVLKARALVLPSFAEGLPVVIMEAMALRRPVISTSIAGIPELLEDGVNGWLVQPGDPLALENAMCSCLDAGINTLIRMGESGRKAVCQYHDIDKNVSQLKYMFIQALNHPSQPPEQIRE